MSDSIERLSYELTASALAEQERTISGLRACAGTVLGAASVAGSLLGATASRGALDVWGLLAMVSFVLCVASAVWVLMPHQLVVALSGEELLGDSDEHARADVDEAYRAVGKWIEPRARANRRRIDLLANHLTASGLFLAIEVALWILSLID